MGEREGGDRVFGFYEDRRSAGLGSSVGEPRTNPHLMGERVRNRAVGAEAKNVEVVYGYEDLPPRVAPGKRRAVVP